MKKVIVLPQTYHRIQKALVAAKNQYEIGGVLVGHKLPDGYVLLGATTPPDTQEKALAEFYLDGEYHAAEAEKISKRFWGRPKIVGIWHSHICDGATFSKQDGISNEQISRLYGGAISAIATMWDKELTLNSYYVVPDGSFRMCRQFVIQDRRRRKMDGQNRCSNCIYWVHRTCVVTGQTKNDSLCTCGQFKPRTEK